MGANKSKLAATTSTNNVTNKSKPAAPLTNNAANNGTTTTSTTTTTTTTDPTDTDSITDTGTNLVNTATVTFAVVAAAGITSAAVITAAPVALGLGALAVIAGKAMEIRNGNAEYKKFSTELFEYIKDIEQYVYNLSTSPNDKVEEKVKDIIQELSGEMTAVNTIYLKRYLLFPNKKLEGLKDKVMWLGLYLTLLLSKHANKLSTEIQDTKKITLQEVEALVKTIETSVDNKLLKLGSSVGVGGGAGVGGGLKKRKTIRKRKRATVTPETAYKRLCKGIKKRPLLKIMKHRSKTKRNGTILRR